MAFRIAMSAVVLVLGSGQATMALASSAPPWLTEVVGRQLLLRPSVNENPFLYLNVADTPWIAELDGECFPLLAAEPAQIVTADADSSSLELQLRTEHFGEASIEIRPLDEMNALSLGSHAVDTVLALLDVHSETRLFVADPATRMVHYAGSNHSPRQDTAVGFSNLEDATDAGMRTCPICFCPIRVAPDYEQEMALGRMTSADVRSAYELISVGTSSERLERVGRRVLDQWPIPLRGYSYRFSLIDRDDFNAVACPGGWIFISDSLIEACESDSELEVALAHEIAHVEMRHGIRQYQHSQRSALLAGIIAGVAAAAASDDSYAGTAGAVAGAMASVALVLSYSGYSRAFEDEADAYALLYAVRNSTGSSRDHLVHVLRKLQYYNEIASGGRERRSAFSSHPSSDDRVAYATRAQVTPFSPPVVVALTDASGAEILSLQIHSIAIDKRVVKADPKTEDRSRAVSSTRTIKDNYITESRMLAGVSAGNALSRSFELKGVEVKFGERWVAIDNKEDTAIVPATVTGISLIRRTDSTRGYEDIDAAALGGLRVNVNGVQYQWGK